MIRLSKDSKEKPSNLIKLLQNKNITKIFHFGRFDLAMLHKNVCTVTGPIYCTKIASKLARTFGAKHGLKDLCKELLKKDLNKSSQSSDWSIEELSNDQLKYASHDVIHLFKLKTILEKMLVREGRISLAKKAFEFLPSRVELDLSGWNEIDIFSH